jgi:periplasmic protein TonB
VIQGGIIGWGDRRPLTASGLMVPAGEARAPVSGPPRGRMGFGLASVLLHGAVLSGLALVVARPLLPVVPDGVVVELVFEPRVVTPSPETLPALATPAPDPIMVAPRPEPEVPRSAQALSSPIPEPAVSPPEGAVSPPRPEPEVLQSERAATSPMPEPVVSESRPVAEFPRPPMMAEPSVVQVAPPLRPMKSAPMRPKPAPRPVAPAQVARPSAREAAPPAPAASPLAPAAPVAAPVVDPRWQASVSAWLASRKVYPEEARRRGEEGRVGVRLTVDRSGRVEDVTVVAASGSALLDAAALGLLRHAMVPAFPPEMTQPRVTIATVIRYVLR